MRTLPAKRPSLGALLLGLIPFAAMCFSVGWWDRIDPRILGLPFNLMWLLCWIVLSSFCIWLAYRLESRKRQDKGAE
jgi:hypothetical protein